MGTLGCHTKSNEQAWHVSEGVALSAPHCPSPEAPTDGKLGRRQRQLPQGKPQAGRDEQDCQEAVQGAQPVPGCPLDVISFQYLPGVPGLSVTDASKGQALEPSPTG